MKHLTAVLIPALAILSPAVHPAAAQNPEVKAADKVSYPMPYSALGQDLILGSGFCPKSAATAVEGQPWGQLKSPS